MSCGLLVDVAKQEVKPAQKISAAKFLFAQDYLPKSIENRSSTNRVPSFFFSFEFALPQCPGPLVLSQSVLPQGFGLEFRPAWCSKSLFA
jgi:hypothetical protein